MAPFSLDVIQVASPCHAAWDNMQGDDRVRHCGECQKNVYQLSAMTKAEAEALLQQHEGRICVRFYRRPDGTLLTADCPVGVLAAARRKLARWLAAAAAIVLGIGAFGFGLVRASGTSVGNTAVMGKMCPPQSAFVPPVQGQMVMGEACPPVLPAPAPVPSPVERP